MKKWQWQGDLVENDLIKSIIKTKVLIEYKILNTSLLDITLKVKN